MAEPITELDIILETCLDRIKTEGWSIDDCLAQYPVYRTTLEVPLRVAARLQRAQAIGPSLRFKEYASERLQARLRASSRPPVFHSARAQVRVKSSRWSFAALKRLVALPAALGLIGALAAGTTGVAYAADGAVPGDSLYGIDRGVEQLELSLTQDPNKALQRQVAFTDERLGEAEELAERGDTAHFEEAISYYDQSVLDVALLARMADEPGDGSLSQLLDQAFSKHQTRLEMLLEKVPEQGKKGIERAIQASSKGRDNALKALKEHGNKPKDTDGDDRPGNGPPGRDKTPGPPEDKKGNGPPGKEK